MKIEKLGDVQENLGALPHISASPLTSALALDDTPMWAPPLLILTAPTSSTSFLPHGFSNDIDARQNY